LKASNHLLKIKLNQLLVQGDSYPPAKESLYRQGELAGVF